MTSCEVLLTKTLRNLSPSLLSIRVHPYWWAMDETGRDLKGVLGVVDGGKLQIFPLDARNFVTLEH
jgi:hypothetical protein